MELNIGKHDCTELWDGVLYKALSHYPKVTDYEMKDIIDFITYNRMYHRKVEIKADNAEILRYVEHEMLDKEKYSKVKRPELISECRACPIEKGCDTEYICHTAPLENAVKIFDCGSLLSALKARNVPVEVLMKESSNAANDTADMFKYIMFAWGNCQAGDRLVTERTIERIPTTEDLGENFVAGVRFFFRYDILETHPGAVHDGFLPIKVKDEVALKDWVYAIVVPEEYRKVIEPHVPDNLKDKTYYLDRNHCDIWQWSEKVFRFVKETEH